MMRKHNKERCFERRSDRIPKMAACVCYIFIFSLETLAQKYTIMQYQNRTVISRPMLNSIDVGT